MAADPVTAHKGPIVDGAFPAPLDEAARAQSWAIAWSTLGCDAPVGLHQELEAAWSEPHRRYHGARHLGECLALWTRWQAQAQASSQRPAEVALALWFHDAVHDPLASGNEINSAVWAARSLVQAGLPSATAQRVCDLVLATRHDMGPGTGYDPQGQGADAQLLVDIDLAILGSPPERFEAYDQDVRKEYAAVPGFRYRRQRAHVLQGFLDRPRLYQGAPAVALLEAQARINLAAAISRLAQ